MTDYLVPSNNAVGVVYVCPYAQLICLYWWPGKVAWPEGGLVLETLAAVFSLCLPADSRESVRRPAGAERSSAATRGPYRVVRHPLYLSCTRSHTLALTSQVWKCGHPPPRLAWLGGYGLPHSCGGASTCLEIPGGQPMSGWFATGLSPAFGDASVHIGPRMSLLYG